MKNIPPILLLFFSHYLFSQTFNGPGGTLGFFGFSNYRITTTGLPNLDGINLGVESLEINIKARNMENVRLYLISPTGTRAVIVDGWGGAVEVNGIIKFNMNPSNPEFRNWTATPTPPATYFRPDVSFNGFSNGQNPNGEWTLQAEPRNIFGKSVTIVDWKITFGNQFINKAEPNDECPNARPLEINNPLAEVNTKNFSSSTSEIAGDKVDGGSSGSYTENTAWFSFVPQCSNDSIILINSAETGMQVAIRTSCDRNLASLKRYSSNARAVGETYSFNISNFTIGQKYYLVVDGQTGSYVYLKKIRWQKGTLGCTVLSTINTGVIPNSTPYCAGQAISVPYSITGAFNSGNIFTAQLSDGNGSFASPVNIGTLASVSSGSINAIIPANTAQGAKYRIRIVSSNPILTGVENASDLQINTLPTEVPTLISGKTTVCENEQNVSYQVSTSGAYTLDWKLPPGATIASSNTNQSTIAINYGTSNGDLEARYKNSCGIGSPLIKTIAIAKSPSSVPAISGATTICANSQNLIYKATLVVFATGYRWKLPSGASVASSPTLDSSEIKVNFGISAGQLSVSAINDCGISTPFIKDIVLGALPASPAGLVIPSDLCEGSSAILSVNTASGASFNWKLPIGTTIETANSDSSIITVKAGNSGGAIAVEAYNGCGINAQKANGNFNVLTKPSIPIVTEFPNFICTNNSSPISVSLKPDANTTSFQWKFPRGYSIGEVLKTDSSSLKIIPSKVSGNTSVTARNHCGASAPTMLPLILDSLPAAPTLVSNEKILCSQDPNLANVTVNKLSVVTYSWMPTSSIGILSSNSDSSAVGIQLKTNQTLGTASVFANNRCGKSVSSGNFNLKIINQPASISIVYADTSVCLNGVATFRASPINGGSSRVITWYVNEVQVAQSADSIFTSSNLLDNTMVYCTLTSSMACATPNPSRSQIVRVRIATDAQPSIFITSIDTTICQGQITEFTASATNTGSAAQYLWYVNEVIQLNQTTTTFTPSNISNNDVVKASVTSSLPCSTSPMATSAPIAMKVFASVNAALSITTNKDSICALQEASIASMPINAGSNYSINWFVNDSPISSLSEVLTLSTLTQTSKIYAKLNTNYPCTTQSEIFSNKLTIEILPKPTLSLDIIGEKEVCEGDLKKQYFSEGSNAEMYNWIIPKFANGISQTKTIELSFTNKGTDTLGVYATNRCGDSPISMITINAISCQPIFIPNIISSETEHLWEIEGLEPYLTAEILVYNRWGEKIYSSMGYAQKWNGQYQGKKLPIGTYYFMINLKDKTNKAFTGSVTIMQ